MDNQLTIMNQDPEPLHPLTVGLPTSPDQLRPVAGSLPVLCPDCGEKVKLKADLNTDWYGNLKYYRCRECKETFVSRNGGELEIADR